MGQQRPAGCAKAGQSSGLSSFDGESLCLHGVLQALRTVACSALCTRMPLCRAWAWLACDCAISR